MATPRRTASAFGLLLVSAAGSAYADSPKAAAQNARLLQHRTAVAAATVTLPDKGCAGSIVGKPTQVLTSAHCIPNAAKSVSVVGPGGARLRGQVTTIDRARDTAVLSLPRALPVEPLEWAIDTPREGDAVLFVGRVDRPSETQVSTVERLGQCPSLPAVKGAIFTDLEARPGDSGAPLVDAERRVVGVIHGGSDCHIATPTARLARQLAKGAPALDAANQHDDAAPDDADQPASDVPDDGAASRRATRVEDALSSSPEADPRVVKTYRFGPFMLQKLEHGYRFRFHFKVGAESDDASE